MSTYFKNKGYKSVTADWDKKVGLDFFKTLINLISNKKITLMVVGYHMVKTLILFENLLKPRQLRLGLYMWLTLVSLIYNLKAVLWATCGSLPSLLFDFHWVLEIWWYAIIRVLKRKRLKKIVQNRLFLQSEWPR